MAGDDSFLRGLFRAEEGLGTPVIFENRVCAEKRMIKSA
jgi:hypothetical protein